MNGKYLLAVSLGIYLTGCATIVKSERTSMRLSGGLQNGDTHVSLPDGQYTLKNGQTTIRVTRSKEDIPVTVTCNNESREGVIKTKYDALAGVAGNIVFGGLIGMAIDAANDKTYDPPEHFNISQLCADPSKSQVADGGAIRTPSAAQSAEAVPEN
ncbi:hypothetical protein ACLVWU_05545 [Bdellovibrio sp. HCB290]|uniref:hypothetical protein n=1 Tax=Bdellovibrio sp. HCB290 TaxID=3394356 RepID=UPI0039B5FB9E